MAKFYIVGGRTKPNAHRPPDFLGFQHALVLKLDSETGTVTEEVCWTSPSENCPEDKPSFVFKAGTLTRRHLWVCSQTEILAYSIPDFRLSKLISLPFFNDLHHVTPTRRDTLLVAVTGLDMVAEITLDGRTVNEWSVLDEAVWSRFDRSTDYRKISTTKPGRPHRAHPNFVFEYDDDIWTTRSDLKDAISLTGPRRRIEINLGLPHDGHVVARDVYFTTVNGFIVVANGERVVRTIDLNEMMPDRHGRALGWCRGIRILSEDEVVVGFTRIRPTKLLENLNWMLDRTIRLAVPKIPTAQSVPTRLVCVSAKRSTKLWEVNLEDHGMNAIFSIHDAAQPDFAASDNL